MANLESINPATGKRIATYPALSLADTDPIIQASHRAFVEWRKTDYATRAGLLKKAADLLRINQGDYARLMALEMGKPLAQGRAEVEKCAWACDYYAEKGAGLLAPEIVSTDATRSFITFQPLGIVLAIMPWNFPFWQVFRFAAPNLMAGNAAVLKHASNVAGCALAMETLFRQAGFPESLFRVLLIGAASVSTVLQNPRIKAVTLTGSTPAGQAVAAHAGALLKKSVLELGGSDPYVVLEDADLEGTVATCVAARLINTGQSCIAAKRFIVVESLRQPFEDLFLEKMRQRTVGDPLQDGIDLGPLARHDLREELHQQVCRSQDAGARLLLGGTIPKGPGAFYLPTVLTDVRKGMPAFDEELFGPVAAIIPVKDEAAAIQAANDSNFGLGAAIFTRDTARGERIAAEQLEAGCCFVNASVKSDPRLPFGGIKLSGYGRELSVWGLREFVNIKSVYVK